jgi:antitoxin ParD1/3/4
MINLCEILTIICIVRKINFITIHISLPDKLEAMVHSEVSSGMYNSASEVVREALRDFFSARNYFSDEEISWLRSDVKQRLEDIQSGKAKTTSIEDTFKEINTEISDV